MYACRTGKVRYICYHDMQLLTHQILLHDITYLKRLSFSPVSMTYRCTYFVKMLRNYQCDKDCYMGPSTKTVYPNFLHMTDRHNAIGQMLCSSRLLRNYFFFILEHKLGMGRYTDLGKISQNCRRVNYC